MKKLNLIVFKFKNMGRKIFDRIQYGLGYRIDLIGGESSWALYLPVLSHSPKVISGGVGHDISFELELAHRFCAEVCIFDPSPTGAKTIASIGRLPKGVLYCNAGLAGRTEVVGFAKPEQCFEGSWRKPSGVADLFFQCYNYSDALALAGWGGCDVLKIDIEGFEYGFLHSIKKGMSLPAQIAVEMHGFLPGHSHLSSFHTRYYLEKLGYNLVWKRRQDHLFVLKRV